MAEPAILTAERAAHQEFASCAPQRLAFLERRRQQLRERAEQMDRVDAAGRSHPEPHLTRARRASMELFDADTDPLDDAEFVAYAQRVEELHDIAEALIIDVARRAEARGHGKEHGFFSTRAWLRHHSNLSKEEARARPQVVRFLDALPAWRSSVEDGAVGSEQVRLTARVFAQQRCREAVVEHHARLLKLAIALPFDDYAEKLNNLRRLADADGERATAAAAHERRDVSLRQLADGSWRLSGRFGGLQGAEVDDVLAHFFDAEWRTDWDRAKADDESASADGIAAALPRTAAQQRADGFHAALLAAAAQPGPGKAPLPGLNVLIDLATFETEVSGAEHDPSRFEQTVCRTQSGTPIEFTDAAAVALYGTLRRAVFDSASVVVDLGRRQRLFTGAARDAALLMSPTCLWFGCDAPVRRAAVDHGTEWHAHGRTDQRNGGPACTRHNLLKHRHRYQVYRDVEGNWQITTANGEPIP